MNRTTLRPLYSLDNFVAQVRGQLIVSCQALPDEPLYGAEIMARMAVAAQKGGARAIRANTPVDIVAIRAAVNLPIIGLYKEVVPGYPVYITPTLAHAKAVADAGADLVAIDATARLRARPGGGVDGHKVGAGVGDGLGVGQGRRDVDWIARDGFLV